MTEVSEYCNLIDDIFIRLIPVSLVHMLRKIQNLTNETIEANCLPTVRRYRTKAKVPIEYNSDVEPSIKTPPEGETSLTTGKSSPQAQALPLK